MNDVFILLHSNSIFHSRDYKITLEKKKKKSEIENLFNRNSMGKQNENFNENEKSSKTEKS